MARRSPCELYIRFLILEPDEKTDAQIQEILDRYQLDYISSAYMKKLREQCTPPAPFYPYDKRHHPSKTFLSSMQVLDLFHPTPEVRTAKRMLVSPRVKEFVESMLLSGAPFRAIAVALARHYNFDSSERAVEAYQRVFWNINLVDSTEMRALLLRRVDVIAESKDPEIAATAKAYKLAAYTDPRRTAANLPHSPITAMIAQMRLGSMPNTSELAKLVELTRVAAVARAAEASLYGGPEDSNKAMNYAITAEKMGTVLEQIVKPDEDLVETLGSIALRTEAGMVPSIHKLSEGQHTVDLAPRESEHDAAPAAKVP